MLSLKLNILGDNNVGKTCLMLTGFGDGFPTSEYAPSVFENYATNRVYTTKSGKEVPVSLSIFDQFHREDSARLRPLNYPGTHAVILCYPAVTYYKQQDALAALRERWIPEIQKWLLGAPIILVRTKCDLETAEAIPFPEELKETYWYKWGENPNKRYDNSVLVPMEEADKLAKELGAMAHLRTSALKGDGVKELVEATLRASYEFYQKYPDGSAGFDVVGDKVIPLKLGEAARPPKSSRCVLS
eukprot:TRINITY_DN15333_c0_g1_i1.p1 TRINITY_DN15333_c0_g1~~TRINITY_DN15333_c0_g1_i1.p1  ORF type:complete len:244 (+),score=16.87 TRINITY_DN15333_c0_g1_i1:47-778(+)